MTIVVAALAFAKADGHLATMPVRVNPFTRRVVVRGYSFSLYTSAVGFTLCVPLLIYEAWSSR